MKNFFDTCRDIFRITQLRQRLLSTLFYVVIFRLGTCILLPWLDTTKVVESFKMRSEANFWDRMLGTSFASLSLFSLGISPYITASILVQFFTFAFPYFQRLQQEGQSGRVKLNYVTRILTIPLAVGQSLPRIFTIRKELILGAGEVNMFWFYLNATLLITAGAMFSVWLADRITEKGLGNGASVLIMVNILAKLPKAIVGEIRTENRTVLFFIIEFFILFLIVLSIILFTQAVRKITLQYARQMMVNYSYGGDSRQYLPIKMNITGVMPIIFSNIFVGIAAFFAGVLHTKLEFSVAGRIAAALKDTLSWQNNATQAVLIFFATFVYASIFVNPMKIANDLKQNNAFISGVKPGQATAHFIDKTISRVIFPGAIFLAIVAMFPALVASKAVGVSEDFAHFYGGTALLIITGVILEMVDQIQGHLDMHQYDKLMLGMKKVPNL